MSERLTRISAFIKGSIYALSAPLVQKKLQHTFDMEGRSEDVKINEAAAEKINQVSRFQGREYRGPFGNC